MMKVNRGRKNKKNICPQSLGGWAKDSYINDNGGVLSPDRRSYYVQR
jgi:hypothetical protein